MLVSFTRNCLFTGEDSDGPATSQQQMDGEETAPHPPNSEQQSNTAAAAPMQNPMVDAGRMQLAAAGMQPSAAMNQPGVATVAAQAYPQQLPPTVHSLQTGAGLHAGIQQPGAGSMALAGGVDSSSQIVGNVNQMIQPGAGMVAYGGTQTAGVAQQMQATQKANMQAQQANIQAQQANMEANLQAGSLNPAVQAMQAHQPAAGSSATPMNEEETALHPPNSQQVQWHVLPTTNLKF